MSDNFTFALMFAARVLHYGAALAVFGYCIFNGFLLRKSTQDYVLLWLVAILMLGTILLLSAEAATAGDGLSDAFNPIVMRDVVTQTVFGKIWLTQAFISVAVLSLASSAGPPKFCLIALVSALGLGALGFMGHAIMLEGAWAWALPTTQALHLLAGGFWIGGLLAIAARPAVSATEWRVAVMRYSFIGHAAVLLVVLSGIILSYALLMTQQTVLNPVYLIILGLKVFVVGLMTIFALINRYYVVPRLSIAPNGAVRLIQIVRTDFALSALVIILVSILGILSPN